MNWGGHSREIEKHIQQHVHQSYVKCASKRREGQGKTRAPKKDVDVAIVNVVAYPGKAYVNHSEKLLFPPLVS